MPTFEWKGTGRNGQSATGVLVADSKDAVIAAMRQFGFFCITSKTGATRNEIGPT